MQSGESASCDFCNIDRPVWRYTCSPFSTVDVILDHEGVGHTFVAQDDGEWYACDACHGLIEDGDWDELSLNSFRSVAGARGWEPESPDTKQLFDTMRHLHKDFREHLVGEAVRL